MPRSSRFSSVFGCFSRQKKRIKCKDSWWPCFRLYLFYVVNQKITPMFSRYEDKTRFAFRLGGVANSAGGFLMFAFTHPIEFLSFLFKSFASKICAEIFLGRLHAFPSCISRSSAVFCDRTSRLLSQCDFRYYFRGLSLRMHFHCVSFHRARYSSF